MIHRRLAAPSDRTTSRLIRGSILVLVIGIPLLGALYFFDQYRPAGPSLVDRDIQVAEEAVTKDPNLLTARLALAQAYMEKGRFADAIAQYDQIMTVEPDAGSALLGRGSAEVALDQLEKAGVDFARIVELAKGGEMANVDPQLEAAYYSLGVIALKQDKPEEAVVQLANAVRIKRTDADALHLLGTALLKVGEPERAITSTRQAIALVPIGWCDPYAQLQQAYVAASDTAGAQYAGGMVALCQDRPDDARAALGSLASGPYAVDALIGLGLLAETQNDTAAATDAYTKALDRDPNNFAATTGLARVGESPSNGPTTSPSDAPTGGG
jgi:tetratricopeptide (TPR) repeat protein